MAGYSGTPLPRKLGLKAGARLGLAGAPSNFLATLGELPEGVTTVDAKGRSGPFDVIVFFARSTRDLETAFASLREKLDVAGGLWISWPKKLSGVATDLTEASVRAIGLGTGLVDNKVCAIDDVWSGLRFVVRLADRPKRG